MNIRYSWLMILGIMGFLLFAGCAAQNPLSEDREQQERESAREAQKELEQSLSTNQSAVGKELEEDTDFEELEQEPSSSRDEGSGGRPSWATSPPSSGEKYVYGVGSAKVYSDTASAVSRAQDQARKEMLKRMEVTVSGETRTSSSREVRDGESSVTRSVMDRVRTEVSATKLSHVEVVDTQVDESKDTAYALVRLDRKRAKKELLKRIEEIDERLREIGRQETGGNRLSRLETLMPALALIEKRRGLLERLNRVSYDNVDMGMPDDIRELRDRIVQLLNGLVIELQPRESVNENLASGVRKALSEQGLRVGERGRGDVVMRYAIDMRVLERDAIQVAFARGRITVLDPGGNVLSEFRHKAKGGSQDLELAKDKAAAKLAEGLGEKLAESFLKSFASPVK